MTDHLLEALERKRPGYDEEVTWHKFMLDAYLAMGGFAGSVKQPPAGFWGAAADVYSTSSLLSTSGTEVFDTYLDRFPREDAKKFRSRVDGTQYDNYMEPLTDLKVSYILRKGFVARNRPQAVEDWRANVDGNGTTWSELFPGIVTRTATLGLIPVLLDVRQVERDEKGEQVIKTRAQARQAGIQPYPVPLFPANLLDYDTDDAGQFAFVKICTRSMRRESWQDASEPVTHYTIWTPETWQKYEVTESEGTKSAQLVDEGKNTFGSVPIVLYKHKPAPDDPVRAMAMHGAVAQLSRAHMNRMSEFNEHLRGQVFALLVYVTKDDTEDLTVGTDNAISLPHDATQTHSYIAPPASVAETYEKRIEAIVREIYRIARVEFTRPTGSATSGLARAYEFAATNRALSDFAGELARAEMHLDWLIGRFYDVPEEELQASTVVAPESFDIEDLQADIKSTFDLIAGGIGPTATRLLKLKLINQALPQLDDDTRGIIEQELDDDDTQEQTDQALAEEAEAAAAKLEAEAAEAERAAEADLAAAMGDAA